MIFSLLQDVQLSVYGFQVQFGIFDFYNCFIMFKVIRVDVDYGLLFREEWQVKVVGGKVSKVEDEVVEIEEVEEERVAGQLDLEVQFYLYFFSFYYVFIYFILKVEEVIRKYQEMMGEVMQFLDFTEGNGRYVSRCQDFLRDILGEEWEQWWSLGERESLVFKQSYFYCRVLGLGFRRV